MLGKASFFALYLAVLSSMALAQDNTTAPAVVAAPAPPAAACVPGTSIGYMLIFQPNISSLLTVGTEYNVSWKWSVAVNNPPSYVDAYIQIVNRNIPVSWKNQIAANMPATQTWFLWTPSGLVNGKYQLRLVPDGKETYNIAANLLPCFSSGQSLPSVSAEFSIYNSAGSLPSYSDGYAPNAAQKNPLNLLVSGFVFVCAIVVFYLA